MSTHSTELTEFKFLSGGGELGVRIRSYDWQKTPLGPITKWPQSLKISINLILNSQQPMWIGWGPEATFLYNDAYIQVLSLAKHPGALGKPAAEVWAEIWDVCGPLADKVFKNGEACFVNNVRLFMSRGDFLEETFYSFSYSPIRDESGNVAGLFCPSAEETSRVLNTRRLRALAELAAEALVQKSPADACASALNILGKHPEDIPFAVLYLIPEGGKEARVTQATFAKLPPAIPSVIDLTVPHPDDPWHIQKVLEGGKTQTVDLHTITGLPLGPADQKLLEAVVLPLTPALHEAPLGALVCGVNPTRMLDNEYRTFYELVCGHVVTAIQNARGSEEQKKRADALAELDRAKTIFFNNVSHELRTPLTLILGPLEEEMRAEGKPRDRLELAHRNSLRLLKLVNMLLDFSRIEAGRMEAAFEAIDLSALTAELASVFRSAVERGGLKLIIDAPPLADAVYVDRDMWEKIVFNLVSNAFKFTLQGEIEVNLREVRGSSGEKVAQLSVRDTGTGIPAAELPKIFDRFHRVRNSQSRSHEGTGIGLALVQELTRLHGGTVSVESTEGQGTTFTVGIPIGCAHLPKERLGAPRALGSITGGARAFVEEATRWLPEQKIESVPMEGKRARILLADDNLDMREYVTRLLTAENYEVEGVANGELALAAAHRRAPDLILSDVMMPQVDGFGLLQAIRADPELRSIPVVLLSARAGAEARIEGVDAGADDYLTKPFAARELLARVNTHLQLSKMRRAAGDAVKEREEKLKELNALLKDKALHLETLVQERTVKLRETVNELEAFSYSIAHDMRAPLRAMRGFSEVLVSDYEAALDTYGKDLLRRISKAAFRMDRLIADVLNYSRVLRAEFPLGNIDLEQLLHDLIDTYPMLSPDKVDIKIEKGIPPVRGNEAILTQIFSNLLGNAAKFVAPGVKPNIRIWAESAGDRVKIFVQDKGVGIAEDQYEKIFEIFQQVDKSYEGTGIGLAIVKKAASRLGGEVGLASTLGNGTTFWVDLAVA